jgi:hypothetical protein
MLPDTLKFWQWRKFGTGASGYIEYKNASGAWQTLGVQNDTSASNWYNAATNNWVGIDTVWKLSKYRVKNLSNLGTTVQFRFIFVSTAATPTMKGWAIDDFELSLAAIPQDAGVVAITSPTAISLVGDIVTVSITVKNYGTDILTNVPVRYKKDNDSPVTAIMSGTIAPGATANYTFTQTFQVGLLNYTLCAYTDVAGDVYVQNNDTCSHVTVNPAANDIGVTQIIEPGAAAFGTTPVKVTLKNFGTNTQTSFTVAYRRNNLTPVETPWTGSLAAGASVDFTFPSNMTVPNGTSFAFCVWTKLNNDAYNLNDTVCKSVLVGIDEVDGSNLWLGQNVPNPTTGLTNIEYNIPVAGEIKFDIMNLVGQKLYSINEKVAAGRHFIDLNVNNLADGVYYYTIEFKGKRLVKKMLINK